MGRPLLLALIVGPGCGWLGKSDEGGVGAEEPAADAGPRCDRPERPPQQLVTLEAEADVVVTQATPEGTLDDKFGSAVALATDLTGDGGPDLIASGSFDQYGEVHNWGFYVFEIARGDRLTPDDAVAHVYDPDLWGDGAVNVAEHGLEDGQPALLWDAGGAMYVFAPPIGPETSLDDVVGSYEYTTPRAIADTDGDGIDDLFDSHRVFLGPFAEYRLVEDADAWFSTDPACFIPEWYEPSDPDDGWSCNYSLGDYVSTGDIDQDGYADALVLGPGPNLDMEEGDTATSENSGSWIATYLFRGPVVGNNDTEDAGARFLGIGPPGGIADLDLDQVPDVFLGYGSKMRLYHGPVAGTYLWEDSEEDSEVAIEDGRSLAIGGDVALAGDVNGDEVADLLASRLFLESWASAVLLGPICTSVTLDDFEFMFEGGIPNTGEYFNDFTPTDADSDGRSDIAFGDPYNDFGEQVERDAGAAYVWFGREL